MTNISSDGSAAIDWKEGELFIKKGFDADYYRVAREKKPKKRKNYKKGLVLDVDSKMHYRIEIPVKMNLDLPSMATIVLQGEVARKYINAPIEEREEIINTFLEGHKWRDMVDMQIMSCATEVADFWHKLQRMGRVMKVFIPGPHEGKFEAVWDDGTKLVINPITGNGMLKKPNAKKYKFIVGWDEDEEILLNILAK